MDCCLFNGNPGFSFATLPSVKRLRSNLLYDRRSLIVLASDGSGSSTSKCGFNGLSGPLELRTPSAKYLRGVLLNDPGKFENAARGQLELLAAERDEADERQKLSLGSEEACLHRRIAELRNDECQIAVEDVMYMLIFFKFSGMGVQLVPTLSKCIYNGRLEIWPSKDWELESIYNFDVLEMVREHLKVIIGWNANSNVRYSWAITEITCTQLSKLYSTSILYGYFLKSASLRYFLERSLYLSKFSISNGAYRHKPVAETFSASSKATTLDLAEGYTRMPVGQVSYGFKEKSESLKCYMMGFDQETMQICAKPKSMEAMNLIQRYNFAVFEGKKLGMPKTNELISTSHSSLKRFMLEAVAFGNFLWEAENFVNGVYSLEENRMLHK